MNTTHTPTAAETFIRSYRSGPERAFAGRLLSETRYFAQTEVRIALVADECGVTVEQREEIIVAALGAWLVRSTIITVLPPGFGHLAVLTRV